jgi:hypothetical protein
VATRFFQPPLEHVFTSPQRKQGFESLACAAPLSIEFFAASEEMKNEE